MTPTQKQALEAALDCIEKSAPPSADAANRQADVIILLRGVLAEPEKNPVAAAGIHNLHSAEQLSKLKSALQSEENRSELFSTPLKGVAEALGKQSGDSHHDLADQVSALIQRNAELEAYLKEAMALHPTSKVLEQWEAWAYGENEDEQEQNLCDALRDIRASVDIIEAALKQVLLVVQEYLPPDGITKDDFISRVIACVDPWPTIQTVKALP